MSKSKINFGQIVAEVFVLRGAKCAAEIAGRAGRRDLAEKIARGDFVAPRGGFNAARARARAAALKLLAA